MRTRIFLVITLLVNLLALSARGATITRDELKQTVVHLQSIFHEQTAIVEAQAGTIADLNQKADEALAARQAIADQKAVVDLQVQSLTGWGNAQKAGKEKAESERDKAIGERDAAREQVKVEHETGLENGRERDVFVLLFAITGTVAALYVFREAIASAPPPYTIWVWLAAAIAAFAGCFLGVRILVSLAVHAIFK